MILNNSQNRIVRFVILEYLNKIMMGNEITAFQFLDYQPKTFESRIAFYANNGNGRGIESENMTNNNENPLLKMYLFQEVMQFLVSKGSMLDNMIINTATNFISQLIRVMWLEIEDHEVVVQAIYNQFFDVIFI